MIGHVDFKTKPVHFYVQRDSDFKGFGVIPFKLARLNEGGAFNLASGTFRAPSPGIYHFDLSANKYYAATYLGIFLQVNGVNVGLAYTYESVTGSHGAITLSASLRLAAGDNVTLYTDGGELTDDIKHKTHFTGWLVEEELMLN